MNFAICSWSVVKSVARSYASTATWSWGSSCSRTNRCSASSALEGSCSRPRPSTSRMIRLFCGARPSAVSRMGGLAPGGGAVSGVKARLSKWPIGCGRPFSRTVKSSCWRSVTGLPVLMSIALHRDWDEHGARRERGALLGHELSRLVRRRDAALRQERQHRESRNDDDRGQQPECPVERAHPALPSPVHHPMTDDRASGAKLSHDTHPPVRSSSLYHLTPDGSPTYRSGRVGRMATPTCPFSGCSAAGGDGPAQVRVPVFELAIRSFGLLYLIN